MRSSIGTRAMAVYQNLPLPAGSAVGVVAVLVLDRVRHAPLPVPRAPHRAAGAALLAIGCALNVWALVGRRRRTSGEFQLEQPESLVTTGPYAFSRQPMYLGWWLIHLGFGILRGSAWVAATLPVAVLLEHLGGSLVEERELRRQFPAEYARYAERVSRYAGPLRRRRHDHEHGHEHPGWGPRLPPRVLRAAHARLADSVDDALEARPGRPRVEDQPVRPPRDHGAAARGGLLEQLGCAARRRRAQLRRRVDRGPALDSVVSLAAEHPGATPTDTAAPKTSPACSLSPSSPYRPSLPRGRRSTGC